MFLAYTLLRIFQDGGDGSGAAIAGSLVSALCSLVLSVVIVVALWRIFTKAGQPGWASLIPIYNIYVLTQIVGREAWWVILFFIPFVNFIAAIMVMIDLAKSFGKGTGFGLGLALLSIIFLPMLAFGDAQYQGPAASSGGAM